jgi:hypothetical protein
MYSLQQFFSGIQNPRRGVLELNKLYHRRVLGRTGIDVLAADWDNLLLLDGCRYDIFEDHCQLDGELSKAVSRGSQTVEFLRSNFDCETYGSIVYVSANPNVTQIDADFHDRIDLWTSHWDDDLDVVPPEAVTDAALRAADEYPTKRLVVHYMQPHFPFIGEFGRQLVSDGRIENKRNGYEFWAQIDDVGVDTFERAYAENLEYVLPHIEDALDGLSGLSVVTSDHGNAFGEWGVYGHPSGVYLDALVEVPWLRAPFDERRTIEEGTVADDSSDFDDNITRERLEKLGYLES